MRCTLHGLVRLPPTRLLYKFGAPIGGKRQYVSGRDARLSSLLGML